MRRQQYTLSDEGFDKLTKKLAEIAQENTEESVEGLQSGVISTNFVKLITKVRDMDDVIERNEQLSKTYQGFLNLYGFDEMYDMYIFARSCDIFPEELYKSDNVVIMPIQKTIIRNGKPLDVTVYETVYKAKDSKKKPTPKKVEEPEVVIRQAWELKGEYLGDKEAKDPANVAKIKSAAQKLTGGNKPFNDNSSHYLSVKDETGKVHAVIGYSNKGGFMTMDFYRTNGYVNGVAARGFAELVRLAVKKKKGVKMEDHPGARPVFVKFGLQQKGDHWVASYDELKESLGEDFTGDK